MRLLMVVSLLLLLSAGYSSAVGEPEDGCVKSEIVTASGKGKYIVDADEATSCSERVADARPRGHSGDASVVTRFTRTTYTETQTGSSCTDSDEVRRSDDQPRGPRVLTCRAVQDSCEQGVDYQITEGANGDVVANVHDLASSAETPDDGEERRTVEYTAVDLEAGTQQVTGYGCVPVTVPVDAAGEPVVITVTQEDFAELPVEGLVAHAGPEVGWVPVNMVNVLYAEVETQVLETELLGVPVRVRAMPVEFQWDLGDGTRITTSKPGGPYPSEEVSAMYAFEGWYDITLTTTFAGQFSVDGGPWQDIVGEIEVASEPVEIFSKSFEARLVDGDVPVDEEADPWIPERTPDTEGPIDPEAKHITL